MQSNIVMTKKNVLTLATDDHIMRSLVPFISNQQGGYQKYFIQLTSIYSVSASAINTVKTISWELKWIMNELAKKKKKTEITSTLSTMLLKTKSESYYWTVAVRFLLKFYDRQLSIETSQLINFKSSEKKRSIPGTTQNFEVFLNIKLWLF